MDRIRWIAPVVAGLFALGACADTDVDEGEFDTTEEIGVEETTPMTENAPLAYGQWDMDADRQLNRAEFATWAGDRFQTWDADQSGYLDETEVGDRLDENEWGEWDADQNMQLDRTEFEEGLFGDLDLNEDTFLDENEWGANTDWL